MKRKHIHIVFPSMLLFNKNFFNFVSSTHDRFGDISAMTEENIASGNYEKPHLAFPLEFAIDRLHITQPSESPPPLGGEIFEDASEVKARKKGAPGSFLGWNTKDIYTMALWSAYIDFPSVRFCLLHYVIMYFYVRFLQYHFIDFSGKS